MRKLDFIISAVGAVGLCTGGSFAQTSCTDWENEYVQSKDTNLGINSYDSLSPGDEVAQTYFYSGQGTINAIRVHGNAPGISTTFVPFKIAIYNVDANNRPTTLISGPFNLTYIDNPVGSMLLDIPNTSVTGNFAVAIQVNDFSRTFNILTNEDGDGNNEDLASYRNNWSTGSWGSVLNDLGDYDFYLEPLMSHSNVAAFTVVGGLCPAAGNVSFNNTSIVSADPMFNQTTMVYDWDFGDGNSSALKNPTHAYAAGSYTVMLITTHELFDGTLCIDTVVQKISIGMSVAANVTAATCFNQNNGFVVGVVTNGTAPFTYWTTFNGLTNLAAGSYTLFARDTLGCIASVPFVISENPEIVFGVPQITAATCNGSDGAILVTATGGTGTLQYSIDGGINYQSSGYFNGLIGGVHTITIKDQSTAACVATKKFTIPEVSAPNISIFSVTNVTCFGNMDAEIVVVGSGGTGALSFSINGGISYQSSGTFSGLGAGKYAVIVKDALGCRNGTSQIIITQPMEISFNTAAKAVTCFGGTDGEIAVSSVIGGTGTFQFSINGTTYQSGTTFTGLMAGTYTVYARDVKSCIKTKSVTVTQPPVMVIGTTHVNPTCFGDAGGSITINATGGSGGFKYDINNDGNAPQSFNTFNGISAGTYLITVTDQKNCPGSTSVTVTQPSIVSATLVVGSSTCNGNDGSIGVTSSAGGSGSGYQFSFDEGASWNSIPGNITTLSAGTYDVIIRDGAGCMVGYQTSVTNIGTTPVLTINNHSDVTCNGGSNGSISVSTGVATDEYSIGSGFQTSGVFTNLPAGDYEIIVKDVANCQIKALTITIIEPAAFVIIPTVTDLTCFETGSGSVSVFASGGAGTISYSIDGVSFQSGNVISNLDADEYNLVIKDALGCFGFSTFNVTQPTEIKGYLSASNVTCYGADDGIIYVSAAGGTPVYEYSLNGVGYFLSGTFSGLNGGNYTVFIKDAANCVKTETITVEEPTPVVLSANVTNVSCAGGNNGVIDLSVSGGTPPYDFQWNTGNAIFVSEDIFNLDAGTYPVTVIDSRGCSIASSYIVSGPLNPLIVNGVITDATSQTANNGEIDVTVTGGTPPYFYDWSNGSSSSDLGSLTPGVYTVEVTDAASCTVSNTFTVTYELDMEDQNDDYSISVFPNPSNYVLNINVTNADVVLVTLIDLQGKIIYSEKSGNNQMAINLQDFADGIYFINIHTNKGVTTEKVVIAK